jgi:hypothetical protein
MLSKLTIVFILRLHNSVMLHLFDYIRYTYIHLTLLLKAFSWFDF